MQYTYLEIEVEVEMSENNWTSQTTDADSHPMLYYKIFSLTQATKDLDFDMNKVRNYQKIATTVLL